MLNQLVFKDLFNDFGVSRNSRCQVSSQIPRWEVIENDSIYTLLVETPGVKKEDLEISVENNIMSISAKKNLETDAGRTVSGYISREKYLLSIKLLEGCDTDSAVAKIEDGILTVTIPKLDVIKKKTIAIN